MTDKQFRTTRFNQIKNSARKNSISFTYKQANTGTFYVELFSDSLNETVTVRVSDHADAYATADYNCDPYDSDMINSLKDWMKASFEKKQEELSDSVVDYSKIPAIVGWYKDKSVEFQTGKVVEYFSEYAPNATVDVSRVKEMLS